MIKFGSFVFILLYLSHEALSASYQYSSFVRTKASTCHYDTDVLDSWDQGFNGRISLKVDQAVNGWTIEVTFDGQVSSVNFYTAENGGLVNGVATASNVDWNGNLSPGDTLELDYGLQYSGSSKPTVVGIKFNSDDCIDNNAPPTTAKPTTTTKGPTTTPGTTDPSASTTTSTTTIKPEPTTNGKVCPTKYDYDEVLFFSNLFYQAQRSGKLDEYADFNHDKVPYRGDSCLQDGSDAGLDLLGGYFDAGDYVKFNFPMASAATVLAWGAIDFSLGYTSADQLDATLNSIKWVTDYLIKCHPSANELYAQVGDGYADHAHWTRVEEMTIPRPSYKLDTNKPGSDLAGETSAALTAASLAFASADPEYSAELLRHSKEIFDFADQYRAKYSDSIPEVAGFYNSWSGYNDELIWSAAWLYKATGDSFYLDKVDELFDDANAVQFSWDDKTIGAQVLLAQLTGEDRFIDKASAFCDHMVSGQQKTPQGMVWIDSWGALRHASNVAFICLEAAAIDHPSINKENYRQFALDQIHYALGDAGRSYVVGFGQNPPQRPHHRSSSCPVNPSEVCDWAAKDNPGPNPSTLWGALVGGPGANDEFNDDRNDFEHSEVACDYNAGFQSALAGLKTLAVQGILPGC